MSLYLGNNNTNSGKILSISNSYRDINYLSDPTSREDIIFNSSMPLILGKSYKLVPDTYTVRNGDTWLYMNIPSELVEFYTGDLKSRLGHLYVIAVSDKNTNQNNVVNLSPIIGLGHITYNDLTSYLSSLLVTPGRTYFYNANGDSGKYEDGYTYKPFGRISGYEEDTDLNNALTKYAYNHVILFATDFNYITNESSTKPLNNIISFDSDKFIVNGINIRNYQWLIKGALNNYDIKLSINNEEYQIINSFSGSSGFFISSYNNIIKMGSVNPEYTFLDSSKNNFTIITNRFTSDTISFPQRDYARIDYDKLNCPRGGDQLGVLQSGIIYSDLFKGSNYLYVISLKQWFTDHEDDIAFSSQWPTFICSTFDGYTLADAELQTRDSQSVPNGTANMRCLLYQNGTDLMYKLEIYDHNSLASSGTIENWKEQDPDKFVVYITECLVGS